MRQIAESAEIPKSAKIGPFCVIGENVILGEEVVLGAGCVLADGVRIGRGSRIGNLCSVAERSVLGEEVQVEAHTSIYPNTLLGNGCFIGSNSSIGRPPRPAFTSTVKVQDEIPPLLMSERGVVGCSTVLYAGTTYGERVFIGDRAIVRERCKIGDFTVIGSGVAIENDTRIGSYTKIQTGSYITAYMDIEDHVFIAPMVTTTNDNFMGRTEKRFKHIKGATIRRGARIGGGSILLPGVEVAPETFVAAGALVTKDTVAQRVVKGFPARDVRQVPEDELL